MFAKQFYLLALLLNIWLTTIKIISNLISYLGIEYYLII